MVSTISWKSEYLSLARRFAGRVAVTDAMGAISYAELFAWAAGIGSVIRAGGVAPGEPVGTFLANGRGAVAASIGVTLSGAADARLNAALSADDLRHCMRTANVRTVVTDAVGAPALAQLGARVIDIDQVGPADLAAGDFPDVSAQGWGCLNFTSGTTGRPKAIVHSQGGRWTANVLLRSVLPIAPGGDDNLLLVTPFSHGAGLMTYAYLDSGASVTLLHGVDTRTVLDLIQVKKVSQIFAPPTVLAKLLAGIGDEHYLGLKTIFTGTAPLSADLYRRARRAFGPIIRITYGKSEIWNPITVLAPAETEAWFGDSGEPLSTCVGWPASGVEVRIAPVEESAGVDGAANQLGTIQLRTRHMAIGHVVDGNFVADPPDAFHDTGDIGFIDDSGRLHLCGRVADVIKSGGYRVLPEEVEAPLREAVAPAEIAIISLPSTYWGEIIAAIVVGRRPDALGAAIARMTAFKRPRLVAELPEIPRNSIGKVERRRARELVLQKYALQDGPYPRLIPRTEGSD
jgi:acyl-CoA synthetase (AMP-forming)/AMP-acid ligase II